MEAQDEVKARHAAVDAADSRAGVHRRANLRGGAEEEHGSHRRKRKWHVTEDDPMGPGTKAYKQQEELAAELRALKAGIANQKQNSSVTKGANASKADDDDDDDAAIPKHLPHYPPGGGYSEAEREANEKAMQSMQSNFEGEMSHYQAAAVEFSAETGKGQAKVLAPLAAAGNGDSPPGLRPAADDDF
ncbi:unnamed protein product [Prorocentrum cordatum]|uniref:Ribosome biogenesis protein NOP53 n=1 Tax=Prorocentrum cordatum TaxID=2364126 RepID=A0ABN9PGK3_9DINO|nr:unnamed protein product [Polarella glacialis]